MGEAPGPAEAGRSILLVAYFFPPCPDTGAHRPAAMAKYLRRLGHRVTVLTTSAYGRLDGEGERAIERTSDAHLWRARVHGRDRIEALYGSDTYSGRPHPLSRVIVPEPLAVAWTPFARSRALRLHRRKRFDCVITSSPPESIHAVGLALRRRRVAWVADLRDAWTFEPLRPPFPTAAQRRLDERLERRWLRAADRVVCVSQPAADDLRARLGIEPALVHNGWDPELAAGSARTRVADLLDPERLSLVYTGRFGSYGRDPRPLLDALATLAREDPETASRLELVIAGPLTAEEDALFRSAPVAPARIVIAGSLPRADALALQREADVLLLLASSRRSQLANFKLYEYLAAGRPILALAAGTEAGRIVAESGGEAVSADDPEGITRVLGRLLEGALSAPGEEARRLYSYPAVAERMAEVVESAIRASR
jgi:glycosyltransferase involved in cell wall biosynthesis